MYYKIYYIAKQICSLLSRPLTVLITSGRWLIHCISALNRQKRNNTSSPQRDAMLIHSLVCAATYKYCLRTYWTSITLVKRLLLQEYCQIPPNSKALLVKDRVSAASYASHGKIPFSFPVFSSNPSGSRILTLQSEEEILSFEMRRLESRRITHIGPSLPSVYWWEMRVCNYFWIHVPFVRRLIHAHAIFSHSENTTTLLLSKHKSLTREPQISNSQSLTQPGLCLTIHQATSGSIKSPAFTPYPNPWVVEYNTTPHFGPGQNQGVSPPQTYFWACSGEGGDWTQFAWTYQR